MIASSKHVEVPVPTRRRRRNWAFPLISLAFFISSLGFYLYAQSTGLSSATDHEIVRAEPLEPQGFFGEQTNCMAT